jgi:hypothetical protein
VAERPPYIPFGTVPSGPAPGFHREFSPPPGIDKGGRPNKVVAMNPLAPQEDWKLTPWWEQLFLTQNPGV